MNRHRALDSCLGILSETASHFSGSCLLEFQSIEIRRRLREQRGLLALAEVGGKALECVEDHLIAGLALVGREIALEHAAVGTKRLDACLDIWLPGRGALVRVRRLRPFMETEAGQHHREPAELDHHVPALGDLLDRGLPGLEDLVAPAGIAADADDAAAMIEADTGVGEGAGEIGEFAELVKEQPGVEAQSKRRKTGKALAEGRIEQQSLWPLGIDAGDVLVGIPWRGVADAAEAAVA